LSSDFHHDNQNNEKRYPFSFLKWSQVKAMDLCYVAAGRFAGYWEQDLKPWDTAAGAILVTEAGGRVTDFEGNPFSPYLKTVVASNSLIHEDMLAALSL